MRHIDDIYVDLLLLETEGEEEDAGLAAPARRVALEREYRAAAQRLRAKEKNPTSAGRK